MYVERRARAGAAAALWSTPGSGSGIRVLPDGCMDVVWSGGALLAVGPDTRARLATEGGGARVFGIRFDPGTGPAALGVPAAELRDLQVPLDDLWSARAARELAERLAAAADPAAVLDRAFAGADGRIPAADPVVSAVLAGVRAAGGTSVAAVADEVGLSERQVRRRCEAAFGYGMKTLERILRMGRALDGVRAGLPLAEVAAAVGYADQPHLNREVKALAGTVPTAFAPQPALVG
ncbi:helix-turn-helix protein [Murinocardiopsis flavida]|uniref:Helix-turn-helix protein n=1 Tax=Murinocardiopsis flavida TaxID=645275 RepID=A0A2P8DGG2_9ACTN|nr:AraC family transcriptional regulator [Murinocardiopsis flavida]PSK96312.1 helix-turn-helix protein [Murinocardiopsis flavida]